MFFFLLKMLNLLQIFFIFTSVSFYVVQCLKCTGCTIVDFSDYNYDIVKNKQMNCLKDNASLSVTMKTFKIQGIQGVIHRASHGSKVDVCYNKRRTEASQSGLLWGAYHQAHSSSGIEQAKLFLKSAVPDKHTLMAIDIENSDSIPLVEAENFVEYIYNNTGRYPMVYGSSTQLNFIPKGSLLSKCLLWVAHYKSCMYFKTCPPGSITCSCFGIGPNCSASRPFRLPYATCPCDNNCKLQVTDQKPLIPPAWSDYAIWQYTTGVIGTYSPNFVPGYNTLVLNSRGRGKLDMDKWNTDKYKSLEEIWFN